MLKKILLEYINSEEKLLIDDIDQDLLIYDLKNIVKSRTSFRLDSIEILTNNHIKTQDSMSLKQYHIMENDTLKVKIEKNVVKVIVEIFQKDLDKLVLKLSPLTSVFMIKKFIQNKTNIDIREQVIYMDNRILQDKENISDFYNITNIDKEIKSKSFDISIDDTETSTPRCLKLKLFIKKSGSKFKLGLDFSFNYLKSLKKINWDEEAPSYREITDGVCLICYCQNTKCKIYNQMFVHNLGK